MSKKVVQYQRHHVIYGIPREEVVLKITRGEHFAISRLERMKMLSYNAILALEHIILKSKLRRRMEPNVES
jgi:hypothetical protein